MALCLIRPVPLRHCCLFPLWQSEPISTQQPETKAQGRLLCTSIGSVRETSLLPYIYRWFHSTHRFTLERDGVESHFSHLLVFVCAHILPGKVPFQKPSWLSTYLMSAIKYQINYATCAQGCKSHHQISGCSAFTLKRTVSIRTSALLCVTLLLSFIWKKRS